MTEDNLLYRKADCRRLLSLPPERELPDWRSEFRRDYARLIHSAAFRRLQGKTQLFAGAESDFFRNRLTHSLEVAQIAKTIALKLNAEVLSDLNCRIDTDLMEFAGLAHDLGHPPFGHTGESALHGKMASHGGFEGNAQTLRILTRIEKKLDRPDAQLRSGDPKWYDEGADSSFGLNLCTRSLASILKYDHEIPESTDPARMEKGYYHSEGKFVETIKDAICRDSGWPQNFKTIECQIMDLADDIAYSTYDIEDAFKAGLLTPLDLLYPTDEIIEKVTMRCQKDLQPFSKSEPKDVLLGLFEYIAKEEEGNPYWINLGDSYQGSKMIAENGFYRNAMTSTLVDRAIGAIRIDVDKNHPQFSKIWMVLENRKVVAVLKHLVYILLIESPRMNLVARRGTRIVEVVFDELMEKQGDRLLPPDWAQRYRQAPEDVHRARVVSDFIAGMTDRQATDFYSRLTSSEFRTMFGPR